MSSLQQACCAIPNLHSTTLQDGLPAALPYCLTRHNLVRIALLGEIALSGATFLPSLNGSPKGSETAQVADVDARPRVSEPHPK